MMDLKAIEAMDGGRVFVSSDLGVTALSVAWEGAVTSVEMTPEQAEALRAALNDSVAEGPSPESGPVSGAALEVPE